MAVRHLDELAAVEVPLGPGVCVPGKANGSNQRGSDLHAMCSAQTDTALGKHALRLPMPQAWHNNYVARLCACDCSSRATTVADALEQAYSGSPPPCPDLD